MGAWGARSSLLDPFRHHLASISPSLGHYLRQDLPPVTVAAQVGAGLPTKGSPRGQAVAGRWAKLPSRIPEEQLIGLLNIALQMFVNLKYLLDT